MMPDTTPTPQSPDEELVKTIQDLFDLTNPARQGCIDVDDIRRKVHAMREAETAEAEEDSPDA
jgi:hypothetical protein